ncbi:MAG: alpha-ketoglutarate-dependent dioxygenase AlkB [Methylococcaceae bacterium]|nr:alpha-ketoglutarate-dependent dioxygenase AlkB [Methylococcaceae bacterium]
MKNLLPFDGELFLTQSFYQAVEASDLFNTLLHNLAWQEEKIFLYGRWVKVPRLMCWYGDKGANYRYSSVIHHPLPWSTPLSEIKQKIQVDHQYSFNTVMGNLYRNGADSMGCHADDEKELGKNPTIASLSLGEERLLRFRHCKHKEIIDVILGHGDLLLMSGAIQHHWKHELPKTKKNKRERINLTFRQIIY